MNVFQKLTQKFNTNPFILPVILSSCFIVAYIAYTLVGKWVLTQHVEAAPIQITSHAAYPYVLGSTTVDISAQAALVMDNTSKVVIYEKNPQLRFSPASTTKLMTALTALGYYHMDDVLTIKAKNVEGAVIGFTPGQKITFENLLYGMLVFSGNDAAVAIADNYPGGQNTFITQMNDNAEKYRLYNTHFGDPAGLSDDETYTTVTDLARLASLAIQNPILAQVVGTKNYTVKTFDGQIYPIKNRNELLGLYGVTGIKTGSTEAAKEVLVSSVVHSGHTFIIVVMRSDDRFADTKTLINAVVDNTTYSSIHP